MEVIRLEVYALIGASGTGKSHRAPLLAYQHEIDLILDDGLLIRGTRVLAGRSAKRERTRIGAAKRALLSDPDHARQIREKLAEYKPERLLILATSQRMAEIIAGRLELPRPQRYLAIEAIAPPEAIRTALQIREQHNRHVVPLPTFAIKKEFPGYLINPLRSFFVRPARCERSLLVERSILRPAFSMLGSYFITEGVVTDLIAYSARDLKGIHRVLKVNIRSASSKVTLSVDLSMEPVPDLLAVLLQAQKMLKKEIEYLTGFYLDEVNLNARRLHLEPGQPPRSIAVP